MNGEDRPDGPVTPAWVTVDLTIFTIRDNELQVLLIERKIKPFQGWLALPGGYIQTTEALDRSARRELREETGIGTEQLHLEQLGAYGAPGRDPRGRVITIAYLALGPDLPAPVAGTDAQHAMWTPIEAALSEDTRMAFDHSEILRDALERARSQLEHTTVAAAFCPEPFTVRALRHVYEVVWGIPLDPSNFRRKVLHASGFLEAIGQWSTPETGRPAALYKRGSAGLLVPPLMRSTETGNAVSL